MPGVGANFNVCRMPVGANDFSRGWYSYDEHAEDFALEHFSIANDLETLVPFIKSAKKYNPALELWASPWSPPSWMKRNQHYAAAMQREGLPPNGLKPEQVGKEGTDLFIQEDKYFKSYADYFGRHHRCVSTARDRDRDGYATERVQFGTAVSELHMDGGGAGEIRAISRACDDAKECRGVLWNAGAWE